MSAAVVLATAAVFFCLMSERATAGAWPLSRGQTQIIAKVEHQSASRVFDADGAEGDLAHRQDDAFSIYLEHGVTDRLTLQTRAGLTRGRDAFVSYEGRGPVEVGLRYALVNRPRTVATVYLGTAEAGVGRNAGYATPGQGGADLEARLLLGRSATTRRGEVFSELQLARLRRTGLADETRMDVTIGFRPASKWLVLVQSYAGEADVKPVKSRWLKTELSILRSFGTWSAQAGWRETIAGRGTAKDRGTVLAIWREF